MRKKYCFKWKQARYFIPRENCCGGEWVWLTYMYSQVKYFCNENPKSSTNFCKLSMRIVTFNFLIIIILYGIYWVYITELTIYKETLLKTKENIATDTVFPLCLPEIPFTLCSPSACSHSNKNGFQTDVLVFLRVTTNGLLLNRALYFLPHFQEL